MGAVATADAHGLLHPDSPLSKCISQDRLEAAGGIKGSGIDLKASAGSLPPEGLQLLGLLLKGTVHRSGD